MVNWESFICLVVIGLVTRGVSSMNEQHRIKNDSQKTRENDPIFSLNTNLDDRRNQHEESAVKNADQLLADPVPIATANVTNSTSLNGTVALAPDSRSTSANAATLGSREQSHSKRHFRHSKSYRKEARTKSRASLSKSNVASGNLIPFSFEHVVGGNVAFRNLFHSPNHNSDSIKLVDSTPKTTGTSLSKVHAVSTSRDDSISKTSSKSLSSSRSKGTYNRKLDKLSSRVTASSGSVGNWDNSSSSSDAGSSINEKASSVELMAFTFDDLEEVRQSTLPNEIINRGENVTASTLIATDNSSSTTIVAKKVETSRKSIDEPKSTSAEVNYGGIDRARSVESYGNDFDDDLVIYSVHTETSREAERLRNEFSPSVRRDHHNMTQDDSVILRSFASESSKNSRNTISELGKTDDKSASANLGNNSNHSRPSADGYSWVSLDDSLNRLSLTAVADNLNNLNSHVARASYSYSNCTLSQDSNAAVESDIKIPDIGTSSVKHSRSLTKSLRELRSSKSSDSDLKSSDRSYYPSPVSSVFENIEHPSKIMVPLNIAAIVKNRTKDHSVKEDFELPRRSTPEDLSSRKISSGLKDVESREEPFRLVLDLNPASSRCSSDSSTERLQNVRRNDRENSFYQRRSDHVTVSVSGNNISESAQCLTRFSSAQTSVNTTDEPETSIESLDFPAISANSKIEELGTSVSANKSNETEAEVSESSLSEFDEHRGAQSLLSSGFIILENFEPVIQEALAPEETAVLIDTETTTAGHFFAMFADPEEHCNASSFDIFIPSVNSRDSKAKVIPVEESPLLRREPQDLNVTTTEDSLYIMEGFGFLENTADEVSELEEDFDRRREVSLDYGETETYLGYPQLEDHPSTFKLINQIEFETKLPVKEDPLIVNSLRWKGNVGSDHNNDPWWLNYDDTKRRRHQTVNNNDFKQKPALIPSGFATPQEVHANVQSQINESDNSSYHIFLLPTVYVFIGICVVVVGCSIWCSRVSLKRQSNLPKLTYFIQQRQGSTEADV